MSSGVRGSDTRTAVVWAGIQRVLESPQSHQGRQARIVDIGGGTGGLAVRLAALGHQVTVVDPSPDALAALDRRAAESNSTDRITGVQGDLADLPDLLDEPVDLVLCHGVLEVVPDPAVGLDTLRAALRPGGALSLLVAQRHAAVIARAMAGHFAQALSTLDSAHGDSRPGRAGQRFTHDEILDLLGGAGFTSTQVHGIRVFADLVPGSLLDLEPGATAALIALEQAVAERTEYFPLATQLHVLARH